MVALPTLLFLYFYCSGLRGVKVFLYLDWNVLVASLLG